MRFEDERRPSSPANEAGRGGETELSLGDAAELVARRITTGVVLAGAAVALAIYSRPAPPRYQAIVGDGQIVRIDTRTGTVIACEENRCMQIVRRGQHLVRSLPHAPAPKQDVQPRQAPAVAPPQGAPPAR